MPVRGSFTAWAGAADEDPSSPAPRLAKGSLSGVSLLSLVALPWAMNDGMSGGCRGGSTLALTPELSGDQAHRCGVAALVDADRPRALHAALAWGS